MPDTLALPNNVGTAIGNATLPKEGPKCVPVLLDFTLQPGWKIDPLALYQQQSLSVIQCVYIDNAQNEKPMTLDIPGTSQTIVAPPLSQGYYPILSPRANTLNFSSDGNVAVRVELINVPMPASVWFPNVTGAQSFQFNNGGALETQDVGLAPIIDPVLGIKTQGGGGASHTVAPLYVGGSDRGQLIYDAGVSPLFLTHASLTLSPDAHDGTGQTFRAKLQTLDAAANLLWEYAYVPSAAPATPGAKTVVWDYTGDPLAVPVSNNGHYGVATEYLPILAGGSYIMTLFGYTT